MEKGFYKVVEEPHCDKIRSCIMGDDGNTYGIGLITKRSNHCGPLCVFETLKQAESFLLLESWEYSHLTIYECEIKKSKDTKVWHTSMPSRRSWVYDLPIGTVLADEVRLLKKVCR